MKISAIKTTAILLSFGIMAFAPTGGKWVSQQSHIKFYSHTVAEDIEANNYTAVSTLNTETGDVVFSVPMQGFEFPISLMQKHYNGKDFLDTKTYPKSKLVGKITNLSDINFGKDGTYTAKIAGDMTIKDKTNKVNETAKITVKGAEISLATDFKLTLADYGINFVKGKPSSNIAKTIDVTAHFTYKAE
jgi:polyisoprenoid-binding protein YceI